MKVILLEDVKSLGKKGQIVNVSDGYARNMILPKKLGVDHPDPESGRGWKNIWFCILQGNLRGSQETAESGY